jgi:hypothetical protein
MEIMNNRLFIFLIPILLYASNLMAQENDGHNSQIIAAIQSGNAKDLATFFDDKIELGVMDKKNFYSREQAEIIMRDFFREYPVGSFSVQHSGGRDDSHFYIGIYKSGQNQFRIYYHLRCKGPESKIPLFKIENNKK